MADNDYYDALEIRDPADREAALLAALPGQIANAKNKAPGFAKILQDIDPAAITSRAALAELPVTRKSDLKALQQANKPFGGLTSVAPGQLGKIFMSPGPIYDPEGRRPDYWRCARALYAAGIPRRGHPAQYLFVSFDARRVHGIGAAPARSTPPASVPATSCTIPFRII